jgi:hypothetical protein
VPAGTALTEYDGDLTITTAGATYSGLDIHGYVVVKAPNVTIKDSIIRGGTGPKGNGIVNSGDLSPNFVLEDSEVVPMYPSVGLDCVKGWNYTLLRDNLHGTVDGAKMYGPNATIEDSWIHGLVTYANDPAQNGGQSHNDDVQILAGSNLRVVGNDLEGGSNSAIQITQDAGALSGVLIDGNWADAGSVTFNIANKPLTSLGGITVTNNIFGHAAVTGCQILYTSATAIVLSGNVYADTRLPVVALDNGSTT